MYLCRMDKIAKTNRINRWFVTNEIPLLMTKMRYCWCSYIFIIYSSAWTKTPHALHTLYNNVGYGVSHNAQSTHSIARWNNFVINFVCICLFDFQIEGLSWHPLRVGCRRARGIKGKEAWLPWVRRTPNRIEELRPAKGQAFLRHR